MEAKIERLADEGHGCLTDIVLSLFDMQTKLKAVQADIPETAIEIASTLDDLVGGIQEITPVLVEMGHLLIQLKDQAKEADK